MNPFSAFGSLVGLFAVVSSIGWLVAPKPVDHAAPAAPPTRPVKFAVLVVFDQMRGDFLERWRPLFGPNGFARLQRDGAWFTRCHYPYGVTVTGPGHASILTGTCGDTHGIVNNEWLESGQEVYCAGSERYDLVPPAPKFPADPTEKPKNPPAKPKPKAVGTPERLLSETVADVLKQAHGPKAKVFGLSLKDRSAILPTGKRPDGAFWFYGTFGTSTYYGDRVPKWVADFNASKVADRWFGHPWERSRPTLDYVRWSGPDDVRGEGGGVGQGGAFPHPTTGGRPVLGAKYYEALANSPYGNDLLLEFAKSCISAEGLGTDDTPDLLVVSFSSNDLIGHTWGPDSQEVLDVTLRSDALMADFLEFLDEKVGKGQYLMGITADHGVCPLPERTGAPRVSTTELTKLVNAHLSKKYPALISATDKDARWVESIQFPWLHLSERVVKASGRPKSEVVAETAKALRGHKHVLRTLTAEELSGTVPESDVIATRMKRSFYPSRCGDLAIVLVPYALPGSTPTGTTHGSPFNYDTHAPLLVYGPGIRGGARTEPTTPQAMASIFAKWLNVRRPKDAQFPVPETLE
ncbi:Alkaline phosphatase PafA precursor [Gemmata obscuriglobus]|uniref:Alkaline phosphatase family protein n=1 Tax=Gemmata obscuriglobus TaxID=114 RepID=A0A2Z3H5E1_9BACT|nr:alkaline phosphatase family protein [Gemmata obscuriglobus]AWM41233.1 alkaline phosphatase family protein [Gemmata obscuriglobus]QEG25424.1 Alkaline phosphatase PafA precursor [Gemmata obscuriglobus]VTR98537.1 alkaline phosphatase : Uncharacterized protein OS=Chloracidobacterium thermophilum (strain B) GN=Cabther_A0476 PE=4 SV=1: Phosphodiest [Gemmata obscuriglobus UQM 2246]